MSTNIISPKSHSNKEESQQIPESPNAKKSLTMISPKKNLLRSNSETFIEEEVNNQEYIYNDLKLLDTPIKPSQRVNSNFESSISSTRKNSQIVNNAKADNERKKQGLDIKNLILFQVNKIHVKQESISDETNNSVDTRGFKLPLSPKKPKEVNSFKNKSNFSSLPHNYGRRNLSISPLNPIKEYPNNQNSPMLLPEKSIKTRRILDPISKSANYNNLYNSPLTIFSHSILAKQSMLSLNNVTPSTIPIDDKPIKEIFLIQPDKSPVRNTILPLNGKKKFVRKPHAKSIFENFTNPLLLEQIEPSNYMNDESDNSIKSESSPLQSRCQSTTNTTTLAQLNLGACKKKSQCIVFDNSPGKSSARAVSIRNSISTQGHPNNSKITHTGIFSSPQKVQTKIAEIKKKLTEPNTRCNGDMSILSDEYFGSDDGFPMEEEGEEVQSTNCQSQIKKVFMLKSVYEGRPATIFFSYPACCERARDTTRTFVLKPEEEKIYDLKYKSGYFNSVVKTFENAGFKRTSGAHWNAIWGTPNKDKIKELNKFQKFNHFPGCWQLGRKDYLWRNLSRMRRQFPLDYNFTPNTYILNSDWERFLQAKEDADSKQVWILKPVNAACGRGIKLVNKKSKIKKKKYYLASDYISNPHLINGYKYDLRLYVLVNSYDPLKIYIYDNGLVRFATEQYSTNNQSLKKKYIHLTNWSVNKYSSTFIPNKNTKSDDEGSKWSLKALIKKYNEIGVNTEELFGKIHDIIIKTIISAESSMLSSLNRIPEHRGNCYELYGFDILIDSNLKPWIMEVNVCPSLNLCSPLDKKIKVSLMCDIMNLLGYQPYDKKKFEDEIKKKTPGMESKKYQPKNIRDVLELNENNCLELLSAEDWNVLFEFDEEYYRRGDFERIFPLKENIEEYKKYFDFTRYNNALIWTWLKSKINFLEIVYKKIAHINV